MVCAVEYRDLRPEEIPQAVDVFTGGVIDLARRYGLPPPPAFDRETLAVEFEHTLNTGFSRVVDIDGRLAAICSGSVRDDVWFLAKFWTLPEYQNQGIGRPLLEQCWQIGLERGAKRFVVWSSNDFTALAVYLRLGMLPGMQLLRFAGQPRLHPLIDLDAQPLSVEAAAAIDLQVRETRREIDHAFWLDGRRRGWLIRAGGRDAGYVYEHGGTIGPAGWLDDHIGPSILAFGIRQAEGPVRITLPGVNHQGIRFALELGLRLSGVAHLLLTAPVGQLERYVPSGPEFF
jgi:GNAT superfamily N-acetyltransferase